MAGTEGKGPGEGHTVLPGDLRFLKWLTGLLAGVMIVGFLVIVGLLVTRLWPVPVVPAPLPVLPASIELPDGVRPEAVTFGQGWIAVVAGDELLVFSPEGGPPRQRLHLTPD